MKCRVQKRGKRCGRSVYEGFRYCIGHLVSKIATAIKRRKR
jgi:hypothetical protein